jgi:hypothetical protein
LGQLESSIVQSPGEIRVIVPGKKGQPNIAIQFQDENLAHTALHLAEMLVEYIAESGRPLLSGEKMTWSTSMIRFEGDTQTIRLQSLDLASDTFIDGADGVLTIWQAQLDTCVEFQSDYAPVNLTDLCVTSLGILEGEELREAVRYPSEPPLASWWFFGISFNGDNIETMKNVHVGDFLSKRPDLVRFLALAPGFCVNLNLDRPVWFDEAVSRNQLN